MKNWGPADWYVIGGVGVSLISVVVGCLAWFCENFHPADFRGPLIKPDPRNKVPYRRRHDEETR